MANYSAIKAAVNGYIKANGRKEITGNILNAVLNAVIDSLGRYFQFAGGAMPTDDPGTPDQNVCYLATEPGLYIHFNNIRINNEEVALLFWNGEWQKQTIAIGIQEVDASVDNQVGTPSVDVSYSQGRLVLTFHNIKGDPGQQGTPAGFGNIGADITGGVGTPGVSVVTSGSNDAKNIMFHFTNLRGDTGVTSVIATIDNTSGIPSCRTSLEDGVLTLAFSGLKGLKGDTGVSADYPITIYNGLDSDATDQALAAAQGKVLDGKISLVDSKVTDRATSVDDADYAIRAVTGSSSLVDDPNGTRARLVFKVKKGDLIKLSSNYVSSIGTSYSGYSCGIWDSPEHCVNASATTGVLQTLVSGYVTDPLVAISLVDGFLGVSFTNGNQAISDDLFERMLASLSIFVGGSVADEIQKLKMSDDEQSVEIEKIKSDLYHPETITTTTDNLTPSSYVNKTGNPVEDTAQVMPLGAKLKKVRLFSTGSVNTTGKTHLYIYDENRILVQNIELGNIGETDTEFDVSSYGIIIRPNYHYAFDRIGYKYDTSIPNGRFKIATTGADADTKSWFGWVFIYEKEQTELDHFVEENADIFDKSVTIDNPLPYATYVSYNNGQAVEDKWQNIPVGSKITKVHCSSTGTAGSNFTYLHIFDSNRQLVGERIQLGQIKAVDTTFDISHLDIIVQEGYHYCVQYIAQVVIATNNTNSRRYYCPGNDTSPFSGYQLGFSFSFETTKDKVVESSPLSGKYAAFVGDSICQGAGFQGAYPLLLSMKFGMLPPQNLGSSGAIVATNTGESRVYINTMVAKMDENADFFIIEGGVNDADLNIPMGEMSDGFTAELDNTTFYGAMETMCKNLVILFAGKKIGYIAVHRVSTTTKYSYTRELSTNYYDAAIKVCEKWGVPYLDLNRHCPPIGCIASLKAEYTSNGDGYHPNELGYEKYYVDRIAAWMQTL